MTNCVEFKHLEGAHTVIASSDNSKDSEKFMQNILFSLISTDNP